MPHRCINWSEPVKTSLNSESKEKSCLDSRSQDSHNPNWKLRKSQKIEITNLWQQTSSKLKIGAMEQLAQPVGHLVETQHQQLW